MPVADNGDDGMSNGNYKKIEEEHHLAQKLQQPFLGTTYQPPFVTPMVDAGGVPPLTRTPSKTDLNEKLSSTKM